MAVAVNAYLWNIRDWPPCPNRVNCDSVIYPSVSSSMSCRWPFPLVSLVWFVPRFVNVSICIDDFETKFSPELVTDSVFATVVHVPELTGSAVAENVFPVLKLALAKTILLVCVLYAFWRAFVIHISMTSLFGCWVLLQFNRRGKWIFCRLAHIWTECRTWNDLLFDLIRLNNFDEASDMFNICVTCCCRWCCFH